MSDYKLQFMADQADAGITFTPAKSAENPFAPGNFASWSSPSLRLTDATKRADLEADGGHWVGTVHMLPGGVFNMTATYFPVKGKPDNVQLVGPIMSDLSESAIAIVGGGGIYTGARGQARCVVAMSDNETPIYRYHLTFEA
jgi:hypothetical protein